MSDATTVTDVPDQHRYEGKGLGSVLAKGALAAERTLGEPVVPLCPFIRSYIDRHPDFADIVDHKMLDTIDAR